MKTKNNRILLLGVTGFLGSAIAKDLDARNLDWIGTSREPSVDPKIIQLELSDHEAVLELFNNFDVVINAVGSAKPKDFEEDPVNTLNTIWKNSVNLSQLLQRGKVSKLVHISSAGTVYGELEDGIHEETSTLDPISWYGKAKVIEELYLQNSSLTSGYDYLCLRVTNPFGNVQKTNHGFIDVLMNSVISGNKFVFYKDCSPVRDFIYADDMGFSAVELITSQCCGVFNLGSGKSYSLEDITDYVNQKVAGKTCIFRETIKPDYDVLINKVCINKLIKHDAHRESLDIFKYIDNALKMATEKIC